MKFESYCEDIKKFNKIKDDLQNSLLIRLEVFCNDFKIPISDNSEIITAHNNDSYIYINILDEDEIVKHYILPKDWINDREDFNKRAKGNEFSNLITQKSELENKITELSKELNKINKSLKEI